MAVLNLPSDRPKYAYIIFEYQGKEIPGAGRWFETVGPQAAAGYVAGYNAASSVVKARLLSFRADLDKPPSENVLSMW